MKQKQPTSVITGAAGFLGSHLTDLLLARGHRVIGIDNFITGSVDNISHLAGNRNFRFVGAEQIHDVLPRRHQCFSRHLRPRIDRQHANHVVRQRDDVQRHDRRKPRWLASEVLAQRIDLGHYLAVSLR